MDGFHAFQSVRHNIHANWAGGLSDDPGRPESAANRIRSPYLNTSPNFGFELRPDSGLFAIGSCFAREIEGALKREKYNVLSFQDEIMLTELFAGPRLTSPYEFLNRYNAPSMLIEIDRLLGNDLGDALLSETNGVVTDLHFANSLDPADLDTVMRRRAATARHGEGLRSAEVVVLTLGLCEVWFGPDGRALNNHPEFMRLRRKQSGYTFRLIGVEENVSALNEIHRKLKRVNPAVKIIVTVSPVPLQTTFTGMDIVEANLLAKSTLLVAARHFAREQPDAHYFPSYEIVTYSDPEKAWKADKRHVQPGAVKHIVATFRAAVSGSAPD